MIIYGKICVLIELDSGDIISGAKLCHFFYLFCRKILIFIENINYEDIK